jgi:hypothetical protein
MQKRLAFKESKRTTCDNTEKLCNIVPLGSTFLPPRTLLKEADCDLHLVAELMVVIFIAQFV